MTRKNIVILQDYGKFQGAYFLFVRNIGAITVQIFHTYSLENEITLINAVSTHEDLRVYAKDYLKRMTLDELVKYYEGDTVVYRFSDILDKKMNITSETLHLQ